MQHCSTLKMEVLGACSKRREILAKRLRVSSRETCIFMTRPARVETLRKITRNIFKGITPERINNIAATEHSPWSWVWCELGDVLFRLENISEHATCSFSGSTIKTEMYCNLLTRRLSGVAKLQKHWCKQPTRCNKFRLLIFSKQLYFPTGSNIGVFTKSCMCSQKVLLRMAEFIARNM